MVNLLRLAIPAGAYLAHFPKKILYLLADSVAYIVTFSGYCERLRLNLERITGRPQNYRIVARNLANYYRYFIDVFTLGYDSISTINKRVEVIVPGSLHTSLERSSVAVALCHCGNWDLAAAGVCLRGFSLVTVAERLADDKVWEFFKTTREQLGVRVFPAIPGVFHDLKEAATTSHSLVGLLADRDISGRGIEVNLGEPALVGAGPAALAIELEIPLYVCFVSDCKKYGHWKTIVEFKRVLRLPNDTVQTLTQRWVDMCREQIQADPTQWHMLQRVFVEDLDPQRLAYARECASSSQGSAA